MGVIRKNQTVRIEIEESRLEKELIQCKVLSYQKNSLILDSKDISPYFISALYEGREIKAYIYDRTGILIFDSVVLTSPCEGDFLIELPDDYKNIQRRAYIRAYTSLPVVLKAENYRTVTGQTIDIGGGGIRFKSDNQPLAGITYTLFLYLSSSDIVTGKGKLLVKQHLPENQHIFNFIDINERNRDKIIKRCLVLESIKIKEQAAGS